MSNEITTTLSTSTVIRSKGGGKIGEKFSLGTSSKKELTALLKSEGLKGNALKRAVNSSLKDEKTARLTMGQLFFNRQVESGKIPDIGEERRGTAVLRFVALEPEKEEKAVETSALEAENAALKAEIAAYKAAAANK